MTQHALEVLIPLTTAIALMLWIASWKIWRT
jgi:hypothetical protein